MLDLIYYFFTFGIFFYFSNPHLGQNGDSFSASLRSMTLGSFVQHAKQASSDGNTVNIVYFQ